MTAGCYESVCVCVKSIRCNYAFCNAMSRFDSIRAQTESCLHSWRPSQAMAVLRAMEAGVNEASVRSDRKLGDNRPKVQAEVFGG